MPIFKSNFSSPVLFDHLSLFPLFIQLLGKYLLISNLPSYTDLGVSVKSLLLRAYYLFLNIHEVFSLLLSILTCRYTKYLTQKFFKVTLRHLGLIHFKLLPCLCQNSSRVTIKFKLVCMLYTIMRALNFYSVYIKKMIAF